MIKIGSQVKLNGRTCEVLDVCREKLILQIGKETKEVYTSEVMEIVAMCGSFPKSMREEFKRGMEKRHEELSNTPSKAPKSVAKSYAVTHEQKEQIEKEYQRLTEELKKEISSFPPFQLDSPFPYPPIRREHTNPYREIDKLHARAYNREGHNVPTTKKQGGFNMKFNIKDLFKIEKTNGEVALTFDGQLAVRRRNGDYVSVEADGTIKNNLSLALTGTEKFIMILPTPVVVAGDVIKNKGAFVKVLRVEDSKIRGINFETGTGTTIQKETNILGLNFFQKVTSLMSLGGKEQAGINPMMLLALGDQDGEKELNPMMLMLLSGAFAQGTQTGSFNPLMLLALGDDVDPTTIMMLSGGLGGVASTSAGGINPMVLMALAGDKEDKYDRYGVKKKSGIDPMMLMLMSGGLSNAFGQAPVVAPVTGTFCNEVKPALTNEEIQEEIERLTALALGNQE